MTYEQIYFLLNLSVIPAWALLVFLPRAKITRTLVHSGIYPLALGVFYIAFFAGVIFFGMGAEEGGFTTAAGISALFAHPHGVLIGWSHYLVFDLFVGAWEGRDSQRRGINHFAMIPCLLLTWIAGPVGLLLYVLLRLVTGNGFSLEESK
jgi:hypothetical protein